MVWYTGVFAFYYHFVKALHVVGSKWWDKCTHLIQNTSKRPDVTLAIIRHVFPHFRGSVVRGSSLGVAKSFFYNFRYIQVSKFRLHVFEQKNVRTFHIPV